MHGQSRKMSFVEAIINVAIGYGVAISTQILVFPLFGIYIPLSDNLLIGAIFTVVSIARTYCVRRLFNWIPRASRVLCSIGQNREIAGSRISR
jgi:hypothetical protein